MVGGAKRAMANAAKRAGLSTSNIRGGRALCAEQPRPHIVRHRELNVPGKAYTAPLQGTAWVSLSSQPLPAPCVLCMVKALDLTYYPVDADRRLDDHILLSARPGEFDNSSAVVAHGLHVRIAFFVQFDENIDLGVGRIPAEGLILVDQLFW